MQILRSLLIATLLLADFCLASPPQFSGRYPHLAMFNNEGECGTGAVVPFAGRLWVITYGPHLPFGSSDKLYEITPDLQQIIRPESVGGTPANRMIHRETNQLIIGPYLIDAQRQIRVIPPKLMPGRLTGNARHLTDPAHRLYFATMEEGLYDVDLSTLAVTGLIKDGNKPKSGATAQIDPATIDSQLPGYHGKGLYSGQGRVIYANNGDQDPRVKSDPTVPSGALGEWFGKRGEDWKLVRRNQFTEVTGPGGIFGPDHPATDPVWSIGWDARSLILMVLDAGRWHSYRLPKGSHSYDGAHGWNTEWPRIRDIGQASLLMTMHGTFYKFPSDFSPAHSSGILPRSNYLKIIGDFAAWQDRIVFGCDDAAKSEFLNKRKAKGDAAGPGQSQSNLWFAAPAQLDSLGPVIGRGALWLDDPIEADKTSDPYLLAGYTHRSLHLTHDSAEPITFTLEVDLKGDNRWSRLRSVTVPPRGYSWIELPGDGVWIRLTGDRPAAHATAFFHYRNPDPRSTEASELFAALAKAGDSNVNGGIIYPRGDNKRNLRFAPVSTAGELGCYELSPDLKLRKVDDASGLAWMKKNYAIPSPAPVLSIDAASVVYVDEKGRWRLPKGDPAFDRPGLLGPERICREAVTERDLLNFHGTFYELPAENAGGFARIRPVTTHNRRITDYCSHRGMLILSGIKNISTSPQAGSEPSSAKVRMDPHLITSEDGLCSLWLGDIDDLWQLGKPRGQGGPWLNTPVQAHQPSDPYLMTGYDRKTVSLSHTSSKTITFTLEVDISGTGQWVTYQTFQVPPNQTATHAFPASFTAYWARLKADQPCTASGQFKYE